MGCSASIFGNVIDPNRMNFLALLAQLRRQGIQIERYNLVQEPLAFARNAAVKALMTKEGIEGLPVIFWDGAMRPLATRVRMHEAAAASAARGGGSSWSPIGVADDGGE